MCNRRFSLLEYKNQTKAIGQNYSAYWFSSKRQEMTCWPLEADDSQTLRWYVDAAFAVHADMRSHTGSTFTLGKGMIISDSTKQKVNSRSSTEAELIGVDDRISKILWAKRFIISRIQSQIEYYLSRQHEHHEIGKQREGKFRQTDSSF